MMSPSAANLQQNSPVSSRSLRLRRRLGIGPSGLVRNNGWRDRCADAVGEPCRGPTAPAVLATRLGDYDTSPPHCFCCFCRKLSADEVGPWRKSWAGAGSANEGTAPHSLFLRSELLPEI